jgi:hypothetical protein
MIGCLVLETVNPETRKQMPFVKLRVEGKQIQLEFQNYLVNLVGSEVTY